MSIIIGCDSFLSLRNVRNGDLGRRLASERVIVLVDPNQYKGSLASCPAGVELDCLLEFNPNTDPTLSRLINRSYYTRKSYYDPVTFWAKLRASSFKNNPRSGLRRLASLTKGRYTLAKHWIAGRCGLAQQQRQEFIRRLRNHPVVNKYKESLQSRRASIVIGFSPEGLREMALVEAANALGIPTAVMIRSRDNLASKIQHLPEADAYFVWADVTRRFLLHMYPEIASEQIYVTGSPQFDHHLDPAYRLERNKFFSLVDLDANRPLIVYTTATPGLIDHEIEIAQHLADAAHKGKFIRRAQLLVRGHPRMFGSSVKLLHKEYPEARVYPKPTKAPYNSPAHEAEVVRLILKDEPIHLATLAYQDVQVNVCGTMTIDSAILDKPTVNVCYDLIEGLPSGLSVRRHFKRSDVKQMMAYGCSRLAHTPEESIDLINRYLDDPTLDREGRKRARDEECGPLNGQAGGHIANCIVKFAYHNAKSHDAKDQIPSEEMPAANLAPRLDS